MVIKGEQLKSGERIDRLGYHGLQIIQNPAKFKFTMDAFLLTRFINPKPEHHVIDLGSGGGVLPLLIAGEGKVAAVYGLEIQPELVDMSRRSVRLNQLEAAITIEAGDLRNLPESLPRNSFDWVITNPPFFPLTQGIASENPALATAKFEICATLKDVIQAASRLIKGNGRLGMIYPTERLTELIVELQNFHLHPNRICMVHPQPTKASNLLLLEARPGTKGGLTVQPPIFVYDENGEYTGMMNQIFYGE